MSGRDSNQGGLALASLGDGWSWPSACLGGLLGVLGAGLIGFEPWKVALFGASGAYAFAVLGAVTVARLRPILDRRWAEPAGRPGRPDLWDPWLDEGGSGPREPVLGADEVVAARALVRPRVLSPEGSSFCLEDEILPFVKNGERGAIRIDGLIGSGKSTALRHLLASLPEELGVQVLDDPDPATLASHSGAGVVVYAADAPASPKHLATFILAPWGKDERIEYLLAVSSAKCGSVMARLNDAQDRSLIEGNPELWRIVLDRMIADESVPDAREALRLELAERLRDEAIREQVGDHCLWRLNVPVTLPPGAQEQAAWRALDPILHRLIRHRPIQLLIAAARLVADLADPAAPCSFLGPRLPRDLVREVGLLVHYRPDIVGRLGSMVAGDDRHLQPMAASLLHAAKVGWKPPHGSVPRLTHAYLDGVDWPGIALVSAELHGADLDGARLWKATLDGAWLEGATLARARLNAASLRGVYATAVDLSHADLSSAKANGAVFRQANLEGARLDSASLRRAWFQRANLTGASFKGADLSRANFHDAIIDGADFSGAILESAVLGRLTLSKARFAGASFEEAEMTRCNLEGMELPRSNFRGARLEDALLTGSTMPWADFRGANLRCAGLAEVHWEGACLANADLRGASFHMGSSRSGLVGSPIASEGSRTGFYTDDFDDQDFKAPEEIRKADLRGVDLRGAIITGVDFYLVDLRGAVIDPGQIDQVRRSGAILVDRTARG